MTRAVPRSRSGSIPSRNWRTAPLIRYARVTVTIDDVAGLLGQLDGEYDASLPVVRLGLEDGRTLDVFRGDRVRDKPVVWRLRGFVGDIRPKEFVALVLGTVDGRVILTTGPGDDATMNGAAVVSAIAARRKLADLTDAIARRVRERFSLGD